MVRIAHADVVLRLAFPRTVAHWQWGDNEGQRWPIYNAGSGALLIGKQDAVVIDGNCSQSVSAPDGGIIHIYGNLTASIDANGLHEIIITGDVALGATIEAAGYCHVFVGGKFAGELSSSGSTTLWIESDLDGTIRTGHPSTQVHVSGDLLGTIVPLEQASLLWLSVAGFAPQASLLEISEFGYTQFNASVARSDVAPGIYPQGGRRKTTSGHNSFNRWCVGIEDRQR